MPGSLLTIDVDDAALLAALDALAASTLERFTKPAAKVSADSIAAEARVRVPKGETRLTEAGIHVEEDHTRTGYVVLATRNPWRNLPYWLEWGTIHMRARPFFFVSATLEEAAHDRRIRQAIQDAIEEVGLGA